MIASAARRLLACALLLACVCGISSAARRDVKQPALVVVFVVDQLPAGTLERHHDQLTGGYRRFLDRGLSYTECRHAHALTMTGPGHATLLSGLDPKRNGIILNEWYDRDLHRKSYCVADSGETAKAGFDGADPVSAANLQDESLGDLIKRVSPASKVYAVSGKDRASILSGGHHADGTFWYSTRTGGYTSNPSLVTQLPAWGKAFWDGDVTAMPFYRDGIPAEWSYPIRPDASPDNYPFEGNNFSRAAPHPLMRVEPDLKPEERIHLVAKHIQYSPWLDWLTLQLAARIIDEAGLGADAAPDLLVVGLTAADIVGHTYGPDSQESLDLMLRVDGWVGELMRHAEQASATHHGGGVLFVLTSDHGVLPLPERIEGGRRIDSADLDRRIEAAAAARLKPPGSEITGPVIEANEDGNLYLDRRILEKLGVPLDHAVEEVRRALSGFAEIERVYRGSDLAVSARDTAGDLFLERYRRSWNAQRGGDLVLQFCEKCLVSSTATGTDHGSPYDYDERVPMILLGPEIRERSDSGICATVDLAPTLAGVLRMTFEKPRDGRNLLSTGKVDSLAGHQ